MHHCNDRPSKDKGAHPAVGFAQEDVLAPSHWHHGGQLGNRKRSCDTHQGGGYPYQQQERGRSDFASDSGGHNKDAGANRGAGHDREGIER